MGWRVERATLQDDWTTRLIVSADTYDPHPESLGFVVALNAAERSANTVKTYVTALAAFLTWAESVGVDWKSANVLDLTRYKRHLQESVSRTGRPRSAATVSVALTAISEFLRYCAAEGYIEAIVANRLVENRWVAPSGGRHAGESGQFRRTRINALRVNVGESPPRTLSAETVESMRQAASTARDRLLLRILHETGTRIGETLGLRTEDVHFLPNSRSLGCAIAGAHLHVVRRTDNTNEALAKSRRSRHVPVAGRVIEDYRDYQHERYDRLGERQNAHLFVNYDGPESGRPMSYSNVYKLVERLGRRAGVKATPHMFRHSAATAWVEAGNDVDVVQELLGHVSPMSTSIYLHASDTRMREAVISAATRSVE